MVQAGMGGDMIATRAVGVFPVLTKGFDRQLGAQLSSGAVASQANVAGRSLGSRLGSSITSSVKTTLKLGAVVTGALAAVTIKGGFDRALGIEDAQAKMKGLGYGAKDVTKIMDNALASVEGTAFGLDAAATTAAGAVAAGIKPGEQLQGVLTTVANTAAATGGTMDEMGSIFNTVAANGKAYTGEIRQIADRGVPIWQALGDVLGKTTGEVQKMASDGKIDFATFEQAAAQASGNVASALGDTTRGSFANMMASVRKLGAMFATGLLPLAKTTFQGIQGLLNAVKSQLEPFVNAFFERFGGGAQAGIQSFFDGLIARVEAFDPAPIMAFFREVEGGVKAFGASWQAFDGDVTSAGFPGFMERAAFQIRTLWEEASGGVKAFAAAWKYNDGEVTSSGFPGFMERAGYMVRQLWDAMRGLDFSSFSNFTASLGAVDLSGAGTAIQGVATGLGAMGQAAPGVLSIAIRGVGNAMQFLSDHADTVVKLLPWLIAGFVAYRGASQAVTAAATYQRSAYIATLPVRLASNASLAVANGLELANSILTRKNTAEKNVNAVATTRQTIAERLSTAAKKAGTLATKALGIAMKVAMGPIGWIIAGITLLATGLYLFFTKTETGKKLWAKIWTAIKAAAAAVVDWFMNTALPYLKAAWDGIAAGALWLYNNAIKPAWAGIKTAIQVVGDWITGTLWPALQTAWNAIGAAAMWLWRSVIQPVWTGIKLAIAVAVAAVLIYIDLLKWYFQKVIAPVALWLYNNVIKPAWEGIKVVIGAVVAWVKNTAWPMLKLAWDAIAAAAKWLYQAVILPVWNAIKSAIASVVDWIKRIGWPGIQLAIKWIGDAFKWLYNSVIKPVWAGVQIAINAVVAWFKNTAWPLINTVIGWLKMSFEGWKLIAQSVWNAIKSAVNAVVAWFQDTAWPIISRVIGYLKTGFNTLRDAIKAAWNFIKDKAVKPVVDWFTGTVKPKIDDFTGKVEDGFTKLKDGIVKAWDAIRDGMKKPINGVIKIYNDHIAGNFNKAIDTIFGKDGGEKYRLKPMNEFYTGGYTGPGGKYQPAGVVHADEYVIRKESQNSLRREAPGFLDALNTHGARALSGMGLGYAKGGRVLGSWQSIAAIPHQGMRITSTVRRGARTAGSGSVSKHAQGLAVDFAGAAGAMRTFFNFVRDNYSVSELIHTPMGGRQLSRGGRPRANFSAATARGHYDHVHVGGWGPGEKAGAGAFAGASASGSAEAQGSWLPNPFDGLWGTIKDKVAGVVGGGMVGGVLSKVAENTVGGLGEWVTEKISAVTGAVGDAAGAARWTPTATLALTREGEMSAGNLASLLRRMNQESGYNPRAINNWDSNAKSGTPSKGLMQVIDPTFRAYRDKSLSGDIYDPLANIVASIRYAKSRYGSLKAAYDRSGGYAGGGWTGPGSKYQPAGIVHADEHVIRKESRASIERARPGFLDRLNRYGASALAGYANGGLVGYASGGRVSPTAKIGSSKVTVILDGLVGTEKQVKSAAGKLADGIAKTFQDRFKGQQKKTVAGLSDSLKALKAQASQLNKTMTLKSSAAKKTAVNRLSDDLASLRAQAKRLDPKKQAKQLASVRKQIESTQSALTRARRGDYSGAAAATAAKLKDVQKQIASTEAALKSARAGNTSAAATKAADAFFTKYAASATAKLQSLAKQSDTLTAKLKTANASLTEAIKVRDEYASSLTEKFAGAYAFSDATATTGIETIIRGFKNAAATVTGFSGQLATLKKRGLSDGLIDQIAQLGSEQGSKVAKNLLTSTDAQLRQITAQYNALNKASARSGNALGKQMYQSGVDTAKGYVNGLNAQLASVTKASQRLADTVVATVRKKLGIRSPSRVFTEIGEFTGDGMVLGIEARVPAARDAAASLVDPDGLISAASRTSRPDAAFGVSSASRPATAAGGAGARNSAPLIGEATMYGLDAAEVASEFDKIIRKREALYS